MHWFPLYWSDLASDEGGGRGRLGGRAREAGREGGQMGGGRCMVLGVGDGKKKGVGPGTGSPFFGLP